MTVRPVGGMAAPCFEDPAAPQDRVVRRAVVPAGQAVRHALLVPPPRRPAALRARRAVVAAGRTVRHAQARRPAAPAGRAAQHALLVPAISRAAVLAAPAGPPEANAGQRENSGFGSWRER
ncbi:MAG TPA: hypothetical protein VG013_05115 [Gemmataceae bacterium]|nr:hypothetical protein [Gemmataceae bacterium]